MLRGKKLIGFFFLAKMECTCALSPQGFLFHVNENYFTSVAYPNLEIPRIVLMIVISSFSCFQLKIYFKDLTYFQFFQYDFCISFQFHSCMYIRIYIGL